MDTGKSSPPPPKKHWWGGGVGHCAASAMQPLWQHWLLDLGIVDRLAFSFANSSMFLQRDVSNNFRTSPIRNQPYPPDCPIVVRRKLSALSPPRAGYCHLPTIRSGISCVVTPYNSPPSSAVRARSRFFEDNFPHLSTRRACRRQVETPRPLEKSCAWVHIFLLYGKVPVAATNKPRPHTTIKRPASELMVEDAALVRSTT